MLLQALAGLQLATDLQLDRLRAHALLGAARQLVSSGAERATEGFLEAAQIPKGNSWLLLGALAAAVKQAPEAARQEVLAKLPAASVLEGWLRLRKQAGGEFVWDIQGFSSQEGRLVSPDFSIGGYDWFLSCFPKGDPYHKAEGHLSFYLELAAGSRSPGGWQQAGPGKLWVQNPRVYVFIAGTIGLELCMKSMMATLSADRQHTVCLPPAGAFAASRFTAINQSSPADSVSASGTVKLFNIESPSWGCPRLVSLARLADPGAGFLAGDRLRLKVEVVC